MNSQGLAGVLADSWFHYDIFPMKGGLSGAIALSGNFKPHISFIAGDGYLSVTG
jgi:hypothetical protein